ILIEANVPSKYWANAITTLVYLLNRMPSKVLDFKTPLQVLSKHFTLPSMLLLPPHIFGYVVFVHLHKNQCTKFDPCAVRCIFFYDMLPKKRYIINMSLLLNASMSI